jgi:hypothetical protein
MAVWHGEPNTKAPLPAIEMKAACTQYSHEKHEKANLPCCRRVNCSDLLRILDLYKVKDHRRVDGERNANLA